MGHLLADWQVKVRALVRAASRGTVATDRIEIAGLRPAFMRFSSDRPRRMIEETAGTGGSYFDLPASWVPGSSQMIRVEMPARQNPPEYLGDESWLFVRSPGDVTVDKILLDHAALVGMYVRFHYNAPWPFPTNTASPIADQIDDLGFEAVSALAASLVITGLALDAARRRAEAGQGPEAKPVGNPDQSLLNVARVYEGLYLRFLGIDPTTPGTSTTPAVSQPLNFDPQRDSMFHGGRR